MGVNLPLTLMGKTGPRILECFLHSLFSSGCLFWFCFVISCLIFDDMQLTKLAYPLSTHLIRECTSCHRWVVAVCCTGCWWEMYVLFCEQHCAELYSTNESRAVRQTDERQNWSDTARGLDGSFHQQGQSGMRFSFFPVFLFISQSYFSSLKICLRMMKLMGAGMALLSQLKGAGLSKRIEMIGRRLWNLRVMALY